MQISRADLDIYLVFLVSLEDNNWIYFYLMEYLSTVLECIVEFHYFFLLSVNGAMKIWPKFLFLNCLHDDYAWKIHIVFIKFLPFFFMKPKITILKLMTVYFM